MITLRHCITCGESLPATAFYLDGRSGKPRATCKKCADDRKRPPRTPRQLVIPLVSEKTCPTCRQQKPAADFPRNRASRDGLATYCKPCHNAKGKENRTRRHGSAREYHLRRRYGIGQADVDAMIERQGGVCAACRTGKPEHVDHDHATGRVRGMLCFNCNQALGNVRDDPRVLRGLLDYLAASLRSVLHSLGIAMTEVRHECCNIEVAWHGHGAA